jgi:hypothetical protein
MPKETANTKNKAFKLIHPQRTKTMKLASRIGTIAASLAVLAAPFAINLSAVQASEVSTYEPSHQTLTDTTTPQFCRFRC